MNKVSEQRRGASAMTRRWLPAAAAAALTVAMLVASGPAAADDPFGFLEDAIDGAADAIEGAADSLTTSPDEPESNMAPGGAGDIGVAPTAMVDEASGLKTPGIAEFTYLQPGQQIEVGSKGSLRLTYFSSCTVEVIKGGTVTIGTVSSVVTGG